jgi:hypothetical protein
LQAHQGRREFGKSDWGCAPLIALICFAAANGWPKVLTQERLEALHGARVQKVADASGIAFLPG